MASDTPPTAQAYGAQERAAIYRAIDERRDMRHFAGGSVAPEVLQRLLTAAHHAPSVGFMQPWRFIRVRSRALREQLHACVEVERQRTADALGERRDGFLQLKVEGLLDAAEVFAVALADGREAHVFGRRTLPEMDLASVACAIQNLWLAARAEGIGVGWVSIFHREDLREILGLPAHVSPVAWLCLGHVDELYSEPELQAKGWAQRLPLDDLIYHEAWGRNETGQHAG